MDCKSSRSKICPIFSNIFKFGLNIYSRSLFVPSDDKLIKIQAASSWRYLNRLSGFWSSSSMASIWSMMNRIFDVASSLFISTLASVHAKIYLILVKMANYSMQMRPELTRMSKSTWISKLTNWGSLYDSGALTFYLRPFISSSCSL